MAAAYWFIVMDVSGGRQDAAEAPYTDERRLAEEMVERVKSLQADIGADFQFSLIVATKTVHVMKSLCQESSETLVKKRFSTSPVVLMDKVLRNIDEQVQNCYGNSYTQRIVLYITHKDVNNRDYSKSAQHVLDTWKDDYMLYGNRSTLVFGFVLARFMKIYSGFEYFKKKGMVRGLLYLAPETQEFKNSRDTLASHSVQCACLLSEDCKISATMIKPCHFNMVKGEEQCTKTIREKIESRPKYTRDSERQSASCKEPGAPKSVVCDRSACVEDCDKKGWSEWSDCDVHGNKQRSRLENTDSHSSVTKSCPQNESLSCDVTTMRATTSTAVKTTTEGAQFTSTWALVFALLLLSGSIVGGAVVFACVRRSHRRRRMPRYPPVYRGVRRRFEPDGSVSAATESVRDASRGPGSLWGQGSISLPTNLDESKRQKSRHEPRRHKERQKPKTRKHYGPSPSAEKTSVRPRSVSMKVSLYDQPDKKSYHSKVDSPKKEKVKNVGRTIRRT